MNARANRSDPRDLQSMRHALVLAERALGRVAPNPAVGCVLTSGSGRIVGRGWTQAGGRPHAETVALAQAGARARGATAYVTMEPCAHLAKTPPCAEALIAAGVSRVVAAIEDPDPRVKGRGFAMLRAAGVEVEASILEAEARELNAGFFLRIEKHRPLVTLKVARSRDGKTVPPPGASRWITNERARRFAHLLRAKHDAVLIGAGTALTDNPMLDCRLPGLEDRSPDRVVLDSRLRLPRESQLARTARQIPTIVFTVADGGGDLRAHGVEVLRTMRNGGRPDLGAVLGVLAGRGYTRLLVEGGATVASAFLAARFVDRLEIFTSVAELGNGAGGEIDGLANLANSPRFVRTAARTSGADTLESYTSRA